MILVTSRRALRIRRKIPKNEWASGHVKRCDAIRRDFDTRSRIKRRQASVCHTTRHRAADPERRDAYRHNAHRRFLIQRRLTSGRRKTQRWKTDAEWRNYKFREGEPRKAII
jgi:hypothetical protein